MKSSHDLFDAWVERKAAGEAEHRRAEEIRRELAMENSMVHLAPGRSVAHLPAGGGSAPAQPRGHDSVVASQTGGGGGWSPAKNLDEYDFSLLLLLLLLLYYYYYYYYYCYYYYYYYYNC